MVVSGRRFDWRHGGNSVFVAHGTTVTLLTRADPLKEYLRYIHDFYAAAGFTEEKSTLEQYTVAMEALRTFFAEQRDQQMTTIKETWNLGPDLQFAGPQGVIPWTTIRCLKVLETGCKRLESLGLQINPRSLQEDIVDSVFAKCTAGHSHAPTHLDFARR